MRMKEIHSDADRRALLEKLRGQLSPEDENTLQRILADKAYLEQVYTQGAQKASYVANKTLRKVYKKIGFVAR